MNFLKQEPLDFASEMVQVLLCMYNNEYQVATSEINEICTEKRDSFFQILDVEFGAQLSAAGDYRCISCNSFDTAVIDFSVVVLGKFISPYAVISTICYLLTGPPVGEEGSSAVLRVSIPTISRLAAIVELESQVLREVLLSALQAEVYSSSVHSES